MNPITIIQIVFAVITIILILVQNTESGIEGALGGGLSVTAQTHKRRGSEKTLYYATFVVAGLFLLSVIVSLITLK